MPKLYSSQEVVKTLQREGFVFVSQRGSHAKYRKTAGDPLDPAPIRLGRERVPARLAAGVSKLPVRLQGHTTARSVSGH
ncbi:MAG: type II toxin-antitoxin system HicA family toxin [Solirubrobacteraceae bacterium]